LKLIIISPSLRDQFQREIIPEMLRNENMRQSLPVHEGVMSATSGVSYGLVEATAALGLEAARYELESAVLCALEEPDATARWLRGERVFAGCEPLRPGERRVEPVATADASADSSLTGAVGHREVPCGEA
jgi:hypothetical protein